MCHEDSGIDHVSFSPMGGLMLVIPYLLEAHCGKAADLLITPIV
jgi:hypothetical protein